MYKSKLLPIVFISSLSLFAGQKATVQTHPVEKTNINDLQNKALVKTITEIGVQEQKIQVNQQKIKKLESEVSALKNKINVLEQLSKRNQATIIKIKMPENAKKAPEVSSSTFKMDNNRENIPRAISGEYAIKTWGANVRQGPGLNYKIVKQLKRGDRIFVAKSNKESTWFYIPKYSGWISHAIVEKVK